MRGLATAVALLLVSSTLPAQNIGPLPPLTAHVDVQVVNVDVSVTDTDGKPVMSLTRDDFEIFEDGKPQKITNFYIVQDAAVRDATAPAGAAAPAAASDTPAEFRRKILVLVDNNYIEKAERNRALDRIEKFVTSQPGVEWAVGTIAQYGSVVQPFTNDPATIHAAFDRVRGMGTFSSVHEIDRSILSDRTRKQLDFATDYDYSETVRFSSREQTMRNLITLENTSRAVTDLAHAYSGSVGKKSIILVTGGMELNTSFSAYEKAHDREMTELRTDIAKTVDEMVREANAANFTVHVVNARTRGMQAPQHDPENRSSGMNVTNLFRSNWGNEPIDTTDLDSVPLSLAVGTGGMYLPSSDITESVNRITQQTANYYSLGYSPAHQGDREYHRIKVNVKRRGVRVSNRVGYFDLTAEDRLEETLRARANADTTMGSLPVTLTVGAAKDGEKDVVVPITAAMSMGKVTLLPRDDGYVGRVHVYLSVFDEHGRNIAFHHQTQEVTLPTDQLTAATEQPFRYTIKVHLHRGAGFKVMMTLRDELSNEMGSAAGDVRL